MGLTLAFGLAGLLLAFIAMPGEVLSRIGTKGLAAVGLLSAALAALAGYLDGSSPEAAHLAGLSPLFVTIAFGDFATRTIPNRAIAAGLAAAIPASTWGPAGGVPQALLGGVLGLALGAAAFFAGKGSAFGAGDAKLAALIGVSVGLRRTLPALFYGVIAGGVIAAALLVAGKGKTTFAYGPYLALGAVLTLFLALDG